MKAKGLGIMFLVSALLCGCGGKGQYDKCFNHVKGHLKDPTSVIVNSATGYEYEGHYAFSISYNAKNSFGAYVGSKSVSVHIDTDGSIECSHCEILSGNSSFYLSMGRSYGKQIYSTN